jgi:hypothetical protein
LIDPTIDVKFIADKFQNILQNPEQREQGSLITMINMLANFEEGDLNNLLQEVYDHMNKKDVFLPTFFQYTPNVAVLTGEIWQPDEQTNRWLKEQINTRFHLDDRKIRYTLEWKQEKNAQRPYTVCLAIHKDDLEKLFTKETASH